MGNVTDIGKMSQLAGCMWNIALDSNALNDKENFRDVAKMIHCGKTSYMDLLGSQNLPLQLIDYKSLPQNLKFCILVSLELAGLINDLNRLDCFKCITGDLSKK